MTTTRPSAVDRMAAQAVPSSADLENVAPAAERARVLARILAEPPGRQAPPRVERRRPRGVPVLLGAGVAAALATALLIAVPGLTGPAGQPAAHAATPALLSYRATATSSDPSVLLRQLAERAAAQPPIEGEGRFDYVRTQGWYLDVMVSGDSVTGKVQPTEREQWIAADGAGRIEETRSGERTGTSQEYGAAELHRPAELPTDPAALERVLGQENQTGHGTAGWFGAVSDIWFTQAVPPRLQAALLQVLSTKDDITVLGAVTDRVGRAGTAVSTTSDYSGLATEYTLILDPDTGALLDYEQVVLEAGKLPVQAPATVSYTVWLESGRVHSTSERP